MAGVATATVTFSVRSVFEELHGPAGSRLWRPGFLACLIEKVLPTWVITPIGFAAGSAPSRVVLVSHGLSGRPAVADVVVVMAGLFGGSDRLRELAIAEGLLHKKGRAWWAEPLVDLPVAGEEDEDAPDVDPVVASEELFDEAARVVADRCRVTVMAYPGSLVSDEHSVMWLRGVGVDVDEFRLAALGDPL